MSMGHQLYDEIRRKFYTTSQNRKTRCIEGLFEYVLSYKKMGLVEPLTTDSSNGRKKTNLCQQLLNALKIDGELWELLYLVNVKHIFLPIGRA